MATTRFPPQKQMLKGSRMYYTFDLLHSMDLGTAPARTDSQGHTSDKMSKAQTLPFLVTFMEGETFLFVLHFWPSALYGPWNCSYPD